jgi:hypothetical protein
VRQRLREELSTGLGRSRVVDDEEEEVLFKRKKREGESVLAAVEKGNKRAHLVHKPEQRKGEERKPANEGRDNRVSEANNGEEGHRRPEGTPSNGREVVLNVVDRTGSGTEEDELDVVDNELGDLKERTGGTGEGGGDLRERTCELHCDTEERKERRDVRSR